MFLNNNDALLFSPVEGSDDLEMIFLDCLAQRLGEEIMSGLIFHFSDDLYFLLSLFAGKSILFPSVKSLKSLESACFYHIQVKEALEDYDDITQEVFSEVFSKIAKKFRCQSFLVRNKYFRVERILERKKEKEKLI